MDLFFSLYQFLFQLSFFFLAKSFSILVIKCDSVVVCCVVLSSRSQFEHVTSCTWFVQVLFTGLH